MEQGVDVIDLGLGADRSRLLAAAGTLDAPGAIFTASHNPAQYNGVKFWLAGRARSASTPGWSRSATSPSRCSRAGPGHAAAAGSYDPQPCRPSPTMWSRSSTPRHLRVRCAPSPTPRTAWRPGRQRCSSESRRITLEVMYGELDGRSRTTRPIRCSPRTSATCRPEWCRAGSTSVSCLTAMQTGVRGGRDRRGLSGSTTTVDAGCHPALAPRRDDPAQPHLLAPCPR